MLVRAVLLLTVFSTLAVAQQRDRATLVATLDSIARAPVAAGQAVGLSVAVVKANDTLVLEGYGLADLELEVPTPSRAVYEIGSVTKQFTAVAVLQLAQQGKLSLDDELTKYLPAYPTQGHRITIRRLLDHTSGIKGYTEMPSFGELMRRDLPRDTLVARFAAEPFDFTPGDAMVYNNSAYFLLGLIIEKAGGQPYEQYLADHVFTPAGMPDSRYCDERAVIPRRAHGYERGPDGYRVKDFISHRWPYSAGSICSTAADAGLDGRPDLRQPRPALHLRATGRQRDRAPDGRDQRAVRTEKVRRSELGGRTGRSEQGGRTGRSKKGD